MNFIQPISEEIFKIKYMINGEETKEQIFEDIAKEIASVEKEEVREKVEKEFLDLLQSGKLMPGGRILANARPYSKMKYYNNCYTIDIEDSIEGIYNSLKEDALISKTGGGVGFNISKVRPKDDVLSKGGKSSGVISFLKVFNESAKIIQTGGSRRAAHICILNVNHPDIEEFITIKHGDSNKELTQFNISVGITDKFINAVEQDLDWDLVFDGKIYKTLKAKYLYELMTTNAFTHNEPGILNLDTVERYNNGHYSFKIEQTNPCGEICMPSYSLCCLASNNLVHFVKNPYQDDCYFDFEGYKKAIHISIRFLDNVLDATKYPLQRIEDFSKEWRRIGLGFTGLGNALTMMKMKYGSPESLELCEQLAKTMRDESYRASVALAKEKGKFPAYDDRYLDSEFVKQLPTELQNEIKKHGIRNIGINTVAPNGTISLTIGQNCSSGIEPTFSLQYDRNIRTGRGDETRKETVYDYAWLQYLEFAEKNNLPKIKPEYFSTTLDVNPYEGVDIQAIWQKYIDHSISKTANLPMNYTYEQYKDLFMYAYRKGLKGFTSFNPMGSMKGILEYSSKEEQEAGKKDEEGKVDYIERKDAPKRPQDLPCDIEVVKVKDERFLILVGLYNGSIYEVFCTNITEDTQIDTNHHKDGIIRKNGKGDYNLIIKNGEERIAVQNIGKTFNKEYEAISRLVSTSLRHGVPLEFIVEQLNKEAPFGGFRKGIVRVIKKYIKDGEVVKNGKKCPECGSSMIYKEGCVTCPSCGWSAC